MNSQEAFNIIFEVIGQVAMKREDHKKVETALNTIGAKLVECVKEEQELAVAEKD